MNAHGEAGGMVTPHGKTWQNNSGTLDPALSDSPGAEAFILDGAEVILSMHMSLGHWWQT